MGHSSYITLQNINPAQNKRRVYHITVTDFSVQLRWGRMDCHVRQKVVTFWEKAGLEKFLQATLSKRQRHGYTVMEKSEAFPSLKALEEMKVQRFEPIQLLLF